MKKITEHTVHKAIDQKSKAFFEGGKFLWKKTSVEIWAEIEPKIQESSASRRVFFRFIQKSRLIAAGIILLLGLGSFLRFHEVKIENSAGQHLYTELPDHSKVKLNAKSSLSYYPFWWKFSRIVKLEGEGFFEVEKGNRFIVKSTSANTMVLGTSFNIFARGDVYKVTCITGTVKVKSKNGDVAVLKPNSKAEIKAGGKINLFSNIEIFPEISWSKNIFVFTASPSLEVFKEIERQYNVRIETNLDDSSLYTGNFNRDQDVEEILEYVCPALGLKYTRKNSREYLVFQKDE